jgi:hypothetical protein
MRTSLIVGLALTLTLGLAAGATSASPMPSGTSLTAPSVPPDCPPGPTPVPSSDPEDAEAARSTLRAYYDDARAGRLRVAWERLSPDTQAKWGSFEAFAPATDDITLSQPVPERDLRCSWLATAADFDGADLSRAYMITASRYDAPLTPIQRPVVWIVAPVPDGTWALWQIR